MAHHYRNNLVVLGITVSMSERGDCWDNVPMESLNGTLNVKCVRDVHTKRVSRQDKRL